MSSSQLPFIVGVTGHRNVESPLQVKQDVKSCLKFWCDKLGPSTPLWLFSGMAEGFDLITVTAATELISENNWEHRLRIFPTLPTKQEFFEKEFSTTQNQFGLSSFQSNMALYEKNSFTVENLPFISTKAAISCSRTQNYLNLGMFLAHYSNVLITYWNGKERGGLGGTADVIDLALKKQLTIPTEVLPQHLVQKRSEAINTLVHHIPTDPEDKAHSNFLQCSTIKEAPFFLYAGVKTKERHCHIDSDSLSLELTTLISQLIATNSKLKTVSQPTYANDHSGLNNTKKIFQAFDANADIYKKKYYREIYVILALLSVSYGMTLWLSYALTKSYGVYFTGITAIFIMGSYYYVQKVKGKGHKWTFQMYRSIAEAFRIKGFLNLTVNPLEKNIFLPYRAKSALPIVNHAISLTEVDWCIQNIAPSNYDIKRNWIEKQSAYLSGKTEKINNSISKAMPFFGFSLFFYILLGIIQLMHAPQLFLSLILFISQGCLAIASSIKIYQTLTQNNQITLGFNRLRDLYVSTERKLSNSDITPSEYNTMLTELAKEAIQENTDWMYCETSNDIKNVSVF